MMGQELKLSLRLISKGPIKGYAMDVDAPAIQYSVVGMPPGQVAEIGRTCQDKDPDKWYIYRRRGERGEWGKVAYDTAEEALEALREEMILEGLASG